MQLGYLQSWSAYETYRTQHPERPDPLVEFKEQLLGVLGAQVSCLPQLRAAAATSHLQQQHWQQGGMTGSMCPS
jgi:hypothetical protein